MKSKTRTLSLMWTLIVFGFACVAFSIFRFPIEKINAYLITLFVFTVGIGSRVTIPIPRFKSHIAVSDTFIFLALLLYGPEVAVIFAATEATFSAWRICDKKITVLLNFAVIAICTSIVGYSLEFAELLPEIQANGLNQDWNKFVIALSAIALIQFVSNTSLAALYDSVKTHQPLLEIWRTKYLWTFVTYLVGATTAGVLFYLTHYVGFGVVIATFPVILLVYLSYKMYLENVEMSISQAEQAEEHAKVLENQSIALSKSEARFRSAFDYAPIGIALVSPEGRWLKVNRALSNILGYSEEEFLSSDFQSMIMPSDLGETLVMIHQLATSKIPTCELEQRYVHKNGDIVWASWSVSPISESEDEERKLIFQIQDITDKKIAEEKLQYEATHDSLTGLPNRAFFMSRLEQALAKAHDNPRHKVNVLFIDLDRFKIVNDSLGHVVGDQLLVRIAGHLQDCLRPSDLVARLGGDEFTILVEGKYDQSEIIRIAERVQEKFSKPFNLNGHEVYSSASIGVLQSTDKHLTAEDMMRDADTAMYQAKRAGKARHEVFNPNMHKAVKETLKLETDLRRAVQNRDFDVFYQPIYSIADEKIEGFEALARWNHPTLGQVPPDKFIPLAEEIGLIDSLGEQILKKACREMGSIDANTRGSNPLLLSVNLSCKQFAQPHLVETIKRILEEANFPPQNLRLEITETVFFEHKDRAIEMLKRLRDFGIEINIDDFGTGYSNLSYLTQLPISTLKIDRTFIDSIENEGQNSEIVQTIITLARSLGMKVIAEGVETKVQLDKLKKLNCEGAQGYYFARPMSFSDTTKFIEDSNSTIPPTFDKLPTIEALQ